MPKPPNLQSAQTGSQLGRAFENLLTWSKSTLRMIFDLDIITCKSEVLCRPTFQEVYLNWLIYVRGTVHIEMPWREVLRYVYVQPFYFVTFYCSLLVFYFCFFFLPSLLLLTCVQCTCFQRTTIIYTLLMNTHANSSADTTIIQVCMALNHYPTHGISTYVSMKSNRQGACKMIFCIQATMYQNCQFPPQFVYFFQFKYVEMRTTIPKGAHT